VLINLVGRMSGATRCWTMSFRITVLPLRTPRPAGSAPGTEPRRRSRHPGHIFRRYTGKLTDPVLDVTPGARGRCRAVGTVREVLSATGVHTDQWCLVGLPSGIAIQPWAEYGGEVHPDSGRGGTRVRAARPGPRRGRLRRRGPPGDREGRAASRWQPRWSRRRPSWQA